MTKDPICGMILDLRTVIYTAQYNGQNYYFCSETCKNEFELNRSQYLGKKSFIKRFLQWISKGNARYYGDSHLSCHDHKPYT